MAEKIIGVYAIMHAPSRRMYVGSSVDIERRFSEHRRDLNAGKHHCTHLQNAWAKYGEAQFLFRVGGVASSFDEARELEQAFLDCYFKDGLYNLKNTATGFGSGDSSPAKKPDWHMKTVKLRLSEVERKAKYGGARGRKRDPLVYAAGAAKRLADPAYTKRLSEACRGKRKIVQCPHCGKSGGGGNMRRYHFDNCKTK